MTAARCECGHPAHRRGRCSVENNFPPGKFCGCLVDMRPPASAASAPEGEGVPCSKCGKPILTCGCPNATVDASAGKVRIQRMAARDGGDQPEGVVAREWGRNSGPVLLSDKEDEHDALVRDHARVKAENEQLAREHAKLAEVYDETRDDLVEARREVDEATSAVKEWYDLYGCAEENCTSNLCNRTRALLARNAKEDR